MIGGDRPTRSLPPRYRNFNEPLRPPDLDGRMGRGGYPPGPGMHPAGPGMHLAGPGMYPPGPGMYPPAPGMQPYDDGDRYMDAPGRRRGNSGQLAMRGASPAYRPSAPRFEAEPPIEPATGWRGSFRPTAKSNSKCPACSPGRAPDGLANRQVSPSEPAKSRSPVLPSLDSPSPEPEQSNSGYKVLPKSYWAGASWRWRLKPDQELTPNAR